MIYHYSSPSVHLYDQLWPSHICPVLFRMSHQIIPMVPSGLPSLTLCGCLWQACLSQAPWAGKRTDWLTGLWKRPWARTVAAPLPHQWEVWQGISATREKKRLCVNFLLSDGAHPFLDTAKSFLTGMTSPGLLKLLLTNNLFWYWNALNFPKHCASAKYFLLERYACVLFKILIPDFLNYTGRMLCYAISTQSELFGRQNKHF